MPKPKLVAVEEKELEDLLAENPDMIEEGMRVLGRQIDTDTGPLDLLALDTDGVLAVIELKNRVDDGQLDQGVRYYDWARFNIEWIARSHPRMVDASQEPRLILIAPTFSNNLRRVAKYVDISLDLVEYHVMELPDGKRHPFCTRTEIESPPEATVVPTKNGHVDRIESDKVKQLCLECLSQLEKLGIETRPKKNYWFSVWYHGKRFMYLGSKKKFFVCQVERPDGSWSDRFRIREKEEWEDLFSKEILPVYSSLGGRLHS